MQLIFAGVDFRFCRPNLFPSCAQNIWPTKAEISAGKYALHLKDKKGAELPINPGSVYKNAGGDANRKTYGFKVIAYNKDGEASPSLL